MVIHVPSYDEAKKALFPCPEHMGDGGVARLAARTQWSGKPCDALQANKRFSGPQFGAASAGVSGNLLATRSYRLGSKQA